jgi:flagellar protein FlaG
MDVQAASATAVLAPVAPAPAAPKNDAAVSAALAAISSVSVAPAASSGSSGGGSSSSGDASNSAIGPTPGLATLPAGPPDGSKKNSAADSTLASGIAQLFNAQEQNISVSFQIEQDPNEVVTVFTDKQTGKVIVQFPSETLIALAKFFDKLDGSVLNKKV